MCRSTLALLGIALVLAACSGRGAQTDSASSGASRGGASGNTLIAYNAGSLARPLRAALDSFATPRGITIEQENAGSLETARKLTDLHKIPDIIALADYEVFPELLIPSQLTWYVQFARNRMVLAYTDKSRFANEINGDNWWRILQRPGVQVGRSDPNLDPNGYRTLLTMQLAARYYKQPQLYDRLLAAAPPRNVRPKEVDLVGLLQAGELDYIWSYESVAQGANLEYVTLPEQIDMGNPADSAFYAQATTRVQGKSVGDTLVVHGQPIVYGISIPTHALHRALAEQFLAWMLSSDGQRVLGAAKLDVLEHPVLVGTGAPAAITAVTGTTSVSSAAMTPVSKTTPASER
ncbi:MAG TPA: extracellular solute-binding protein [Gemmatimonadaceae bacterium]|nr:extracellular solute-binding protein [Gemmatimonadaceae bacterium]